MAIYGAEIYVPGVGDGVPGTRTLPGSGLSVPAGLEAIFEYNSLFLNVRRNVDQYRITGFDGLNDADVRDTRDANTDDDGETPYNSFYGGRPMVMTGTIRTYSLSKLRDMQTALRTAFSDLTTEYPLRFRTGDYTKDHIIYCKKTGAITMGEAQQNQMYERDFQISLRASNPRFLSFVQNFIDVNPAPELVPTQIALILNRGNYRAQPTYRMYGPATSVTITSGLTNKSFTVIDIPPGDYLEFNTARPNRTLRDSSGDNQWKLLNDDSDDVYLKGGENGEYNPILYDGDCSRIQISWRDSWM